MAASATLRELHGIIQTAMGWEGIHLYAFPTRAAHYGSLELGIQSPKVTLESFRFRNNAKLVYVYDMRDWWEHESRVEDRIEAVGRKRYAFCTDGRGACPSEECGGPRGYRARLEEASGFDALKDLATMAGLLKEIVLEHRPELLDDPDEREELETIVGRMQARQPFFDDDFSCRAVNAGFRQGEHIRLMHQWF